MAEKVRITDYKVNRVTEWETGLPNADDLPPLSQNLISPELASAFSITPEPHRSVLDVDRASHNTLSTLQQFNKVKSFSEDEMNVEEEEEITVDLIPIPESSDSRKLRRIDSSERKKVRVVWTPQLHKRFVEVVAHLGVKNAVPKTIMQLMNVEGLSRENVASHLQKYRLYVKRMHEVSYNGLYNSDDLSNQQHRVPN